MKQQHPNCRNPDCKVCLADHLALQEKLNTLSGTDKVDHLSRFRDFLIKKGIQPDTEFGWGTTATFSDLMHEEYLNEFRKLS